MGLYDRDYSREPEPGFRVTAPQSLFTQLVLVTGAVYLAQIASPQVTEWLSLKADWYRRPWQFYQLLTYGFVHDPRDMKHILFNMLGLWMLTPDLEQRYGRREILTFYLTTIVFAGAFWTVSELSFGRGAMLMGASGGIVGLLVLFAFNFPHRQVLFFFVLPMPMWVAALIFELVDVWGAISRSGNVAHVAHLAGAVFGLYYYKLDLRLAPLFARLVPRTGGLSRPRLRVHEPDPSDKEDDLSRKVDEILQKIQEQGQDSLTAGERKLLERASRRYQQKRK